MADVRSRPSRAVKSRVSGSAVTVGGPKERLGLLRRGPYLYEAGGRAHVPLQAERALPSDCYTKIRCVVVVFLLSKLTRHGEEGAKVTTSALQGKEGKLSAVGAR